MTSSEQAQRPSLREEQKTVTKRRLMAAAEETFVAAGFLSTTVDDITAAAGVSRATFYLHFPNKLALLHEIAVGYIPPMTELYGRLDVVLAEDGGREGLRAWAGDVFRYLEENQRGAATFAQASIVDREFVTRHVTAVVDQVLDAMPRYVALWPPAGREEARLRLMFLMMQLDRIAVHVLANESHPADRELVIDLVCEQLVNFLRPAEIKTGRVRRMAGLR